MAPVKLMERLPCCGHGVDMNYSRSAIDAHLVRVDTGKRERGRGMLKGPLYILPEEYRGQRQTFQSDIGIRCGGIGLSKISQGEHEFTFAGRRNVSLPPNWRQTCRNSARLQ